MVQPDGAGELAGGVEETQVTAGSGEVDPAGGQRQPGRAEHGRQSGDLLADRRPEQPAGFDPVQERGVVPSRRVGLGDRAGLRGGSQFGAVGGAESPGRGQGCLSSVDPARGTDVREGEEVIEREVAVGVHLDGVARGRSPGRADTLGGGYGRHRATAAETLVRTWR
ncbi:MAG: hypothetical protein ACRDSP_14720 [Pseudonocardiaceae bacterium]